jgi:hypothetical protein
VCVRVCVCVCACVCVCVYVCLCLFKKYPLSTFLCLGCWRPVHAAHTADEPITLQLTPIPPQLEIDAPEPGAVASFYSTLLSTAASISRGDATKSTASGSSGRGSGGPASEADALSAPVSFEAATPMHSHGELSENVLTHRMLSVWGIQQPFSFELLGADGALCVCVCPQWAVSSSLTCDLCQF